MISDLIMSQYWSLMLKWQDLLLTSQHGEYGNRTFYLLEYLIFENVIINRRVAI